MADTHHTNPAAPPTGSVQEDHIDLKAILVFLGGLTVFGAIIQLVIWVMFGFLTNQEARSQTVQYPMGLSQLDRTPPEPRLQTRPEVDLKAMRAEEDQILHRYGWVDEGAGVARIPVDRAMQLLIERGLPVREGATAAPVITTDALTLGAPGAYRKAHEGAAEPNEQQAGK